MPALEKLMATDASATESTALATEERQVGLEALTC